MQTALTLLALAAWSAQAYTWTNARYGGGGYITGFKFHPAVKGLVYARTDIGGAYRRDPGSMKWIPLQDDTSRGDWEMLGVLSMAVDPTDGKKVYMATGTYTGVHAAYATLLRSADRGQTWSRTALPFKLGGNEDGRGSGDRLQVDPNLPSTLFLGTSKDGLWTSTDSGLTWSRITNFYPASVTFVTIDDTSARPGSASQIIFVGAAVTDGSPTVFQSSDGGKSWGAAINHPIGLMAVRGTLDGAGNMYVAFSDFPPPGEGKKGAVYKCNIKAATWVNITPPQTLPCAFAGVAVSRENPQIVVISTLDRWTIGDDLYRSMNGGRTWTAMNAISSRSTVGYPWLEANFKAANAMGHWITDVAMDPYADDHLIYNTGFGLWETTTALCRAVVWSFNVDGIEETVTLGMASPPSGSTHLMAVMGDVNGANYKDNILDVSGYYSKATNGISVDYAQYWASFMSRTVNDDKKGYLSWNSGDTWYPIASHPVSSKAHTGGKIAIGADGSTLLWAPCGQGAYYSSDNGASWGAASGYPATDPDDSQKCHQPIADRTDGSYFYVYDFSNGLIAESSDKGRTWHTMFKGLDVLATWMSEHTLLSVPTGRRDLWLGSGYGLWHVTGPGASAPVKIAGVQAAYGVGYGASRDGKGYPALYITGKIDNKIGIYQSLDAGVTWVRINDDQHQYGVVNYIVGDPRVFGTVYIAANGRGIFKGTP